MDLRLSTGTGGGAGDETNLRKALVLVLIGAGVIWFGYSDYTTQEERVENAIEVDAEILDTDVDRRSGSSSTTYYPSVEFEYTYEGTTYTSSNVHATESRSGHSSRSSAESVTDDYPEGDTVTAYLDPNEPGAAFLDVDHSNGPYLWMGLGAVFVLAGSSIFVKAQLATRGIEDE